MIKTLRSIHDFLSHQSLYPLILSSGLAVTFYILRVLYAHNWNYSNLMWNLFLAWVPYVFSFLAATFHRLLPKQWWLIPLTALPWLAFFPNAPYMVTDFYHLAERPPVPFWYDIGLITIFAFAGFFLAIASLRTMHQLVEASLGKLTGWLFAILVLSLAGLGVYLGRFGRYNSWDLLIQPKACAQRYRPPAAQPAGQSRFCRFHPDVHLHYDRLLPDVRVSQSHRTCSNPNSARQ